MKNFFWCSVGAVSLSVLFCFLLFSRICQKCAFAVFRVPLRYQPCSAYNVLIKINKKR